MGCMAGPANTQFAVAVHFLAYLAGAGQGRPVSSDEVARSAAVSPVYLRRVLGPLRAAGLVRSRPGSGGGWELCRSPDEIGLDEVWSIVQGEHAVLGLHGPSPDCPIGAGLIGVFDGIEGRVAAAIERELAACTIGAVLRQATDTAGGHAGQSNSPVDLAETWWSAGDVRPVGSGDRQHVVGRQLDL